jgi:YVTN family beta-propeller protein
MNLNFIKTSQILIYPVLAAIVSSSCEKSDNSKTLYSNGAFIVNEGNFTGVNGTIGYYNFEKDTVENDIFYEVNNRSLGDVVQSMSVFNGKAYIVVSNSNKVEVADAETFVESGVIEGVSAPRYFISDGTNGYLTCWGDNSVKVIDLESNTVINSIPVASGPEKMCIVNTKLYVINTGGWATDSTLSVIDLTTHELERNIEIGYAPSDLVVDTNENIWVLCFGKVVYGTEDPYPILEETPSELYRVNSSDYTAVRVKTLFEHEHPTQLEVSTNGDLYFGGGYSFGGIYKFSAEDQTYSMIIADYAYGLNIDPETDEIYITLAGDYTTAGSIKRFTHEGALLGTYTCGIGPNSVVFN